MLLLFVLIETYSTILELGIWNWSITKVQIQPNSKLTYFWICNFCSWCLAIWMFRIRNGRYAILSNIASSSSSEPCLLSKTSRTQPCESVTGSKLKMMYRNLLITAVIIHSMQYDKLYEYLSKILTTQNYLK